MSLLFIYIVVLVFISISAVCSALMDKVETTIQFNDSIFCNKNPLYWSKVYSAEHNGFIKGTNRRRDAWHDAKSIGIIANAFAYNLMILFGYFIVKYFYNDYLLFLLLSVILHPIIHGVIWILTFNLFYNHIFKK